MISIGSKFTQSVGSYTRYGADGSFASAMEFPGAGMAHLQRALLTKPRPLWSRACQAIGINQQHNQPTRK